MLRPYPLLGIGLLLIGVAGALAVPQPKEKTQVATNQTDATSVGDFVVQYAQAMGLVGKNATAEQAVAALKSSGVIGTTPSNLQAPLTEGDVVRIAKKHLRITTNNPERAFTSSQTSDFFNVFGSEIRQLAQGDDRGAFSQKQFQPSEGPSVPPVRPPQAADPGTKGKGKKKGLSDHFPF